jgi:hypothetical protein
MEKSAPFMDFRVSWNSPRSGTEFREKMKFDGIANIAITVWTLFIMWKKVKISALYGKAPVQLLNDDI